MTSGRHTDLATQATKDSPRRSLRLRLKPKGPPTGYVDGAWWPHSHELPDELTALVDVLAVRLGPVTRVAFAAAAWNPVSEEAGRTIRLAALRSQEHHIVRVSGTEGRQLTLLVVPPETSDEAGHDAIMLAARRANSDQPADILAGAGAIPDASHKNNKHRSSRPRMRTRRPQH